MTAPPPVSTAHPSSDATAGGTSAGTGTTERRSTTACVAKPDTPRWWLTGWPSRDSRRSPAIRVPAALAALPGSHGVSPLVAQAGQCAAPRQKGHDDALPDGHVGDGGAGLLDDARRLVSEQHRHRAHPVAVDHRQVGMAQPCGLDADQQFGVAGRREVELADGERPRFGVRPGPSDLFEHSAADPHDHQPAVTGRLLP